MNLINFYSGVPNLQVLHHPGVKEQNIPRERNIAEADHAVIATDDLENRKKHNEDDPAVISPRAVVTDRAADLEKEI